MNGNGAGDDAVDGGLGEGVELAITAAHELGLEQIAGAAVQLEDTLVELHCQI